MPLLTQPIILYKYNPLLIFKNKKLNVYTYVYTQEEGRTGKKSDIHRSEKRRWKRPMECTPRIRVFGAHHFNSPFNPQTSCWYTLCISHNHDNQSVINKCSIYRLGNSKCQIQYHERGLQIEYNFMRAGILSCSYSSNALKSAKHIINICLMNF